MSKLRKRASRQTRSKNIESVSSCDIDFFDAKKITQLIKKMRPQSELYELSELFAILGDTTRLKIVLALIETELCVCDMAGFLRITKSAVSHHLRLLRNLRLVKFRRSGKMVYYSLDDHHIKGLLTQAAEHIGEQQWT
jgi:ArsR family transcriptional regulator